MSYVMVSALFACCRRCAKTIPECKSPHVCCTINWLKNKLQRVWLEFDLQLHNDSIEIGNMRANIALLFEHYMQGKISLLAMRLQCLSYAMVTKLHWRQLVLSLNCILQIIILWVYSCWEETLACVRVTNTQTHKYTNTQTHLTTAARNPRCTLCSLHSTYTAWTTQ